MNPPCFQSFGRNHESIERVLNAMYKMHQQCGDFEQAKTIDCRIKEIHKQRTQRPFDVLHTALTKSNDSECYSMLYREYKECLNV
jgi:hypothetical protein